MKFREKAVHKINNLMKLQMHVTNAEVKLS
jgi:hypothetical protein